MDSPGHHFCVHWNNHQNNLLTVMSELLENNTLTDVTLGTDDGRSIACHKTILAACSSYFQTLFMQYPWKHPLVVLSGVKYSEVIRIVEFMYKGEVNVAEDELDAILKAAAALQVKGLTDANQSSPYDDVPPPPMEDTIDAEVHLADATKSGRHRRKSFSPAYVSSKPYHAYEQAADIRDNQLIATPQAWPLSQALPPSPQDLAAASAAYQSSLPTTRCPSLLDKDCEEAAKVRVPRSRKRKMSRENVINRGTTFLRHALKPSHETASPLHVPTHIDPGNHDKHYRHTSNGSTNPAGNAERDDERSRADPSCHPRAQSSRVTDDASTINDEDNTSLLSFSEGSKAGIASSTPTPTHEGKRYKKYSKADLADAIYAVEQGMSANKAAVLFKVPSRTLYDKIKKLGYTNTKPRCSRSNSNTSSACFPYGIGGNVDGSIYGNMIENDNENSRDSTETIENAVDAYHCPESHDDTAVRENMAKDKDQRMSSHKCRSHSQSPIPTHSPRQEPPPTAADYGNDDVAEDLSMSRKSDNTSSIPPSVVIKYET